jgi:hypothetical protein
MLVFRHRHFSDKAVTRPLTFVVCNPLLIMALTIGAQLGFHEITALLGKGGMGDWYRARDTKLKREVATRFCPKSSRVIQKSPGFSVRQKFS